MLTRIFTAIRNTLREEYEAYRERCDDEAATAFMYGISMI